MKHTYLITLVIVLFSKSATAMFSDDPWLTKVMSEFEYFSGHDETGIEWDIDVWSGRDLSKLWFKTSGEYSDSELEGAYIELAYSHAISAYWDQQFGARYDLESADDVDARLWLSYGYIGTAPYFVEVDARLFVGQESSTQLLIELEREFMITQEWVLAPELDIIVNGRTNPLYAEGSGLAELEFSLRLGYERNGNRKLQPFVGLSTTQKFGGTRRMAALEGEGANQTKLMIGVHSWF